MQRNAKFSIVVLTIFMLMLVGCNVKSRHYTDTAFKNLKTFTKVTRVENNDIEETVSEVSFTYILDDRGDEAIDKYEKYLLEGYGFHIDEQTMKEDYTAFVKDEYTLVATTEETAGRLVYKLTIPWSKQKVEQNLKEYYEKVQQLIEEKKYVEAMEILQGNQVLLDYQDSRLALDYCRGMIAAGYTRYGSAIEYLKDVVAKNKDYRDTDEQLQAIYDIVSKYDGTYYCDHLKYPGRGIGYYIFVKDGKVATELETTYQDGEEVYYMYDLVEKQFSTGKKELMIGSAVYKDRKLTETEYEYSFMENANGTITVISYETNEYSTFNGIYHKTSSKTPKSK